jgi:hypothetical protein
MTAGLGRSLAGSRSAGVGTMLDGAALGNFTSVAETVP